MSISHERMNEILIEDFELVTDREMFYHYSSLDTATEHILKGNTLRFSDPTTFNDPFDCSEKILQVSYNPKLIKNILKDSNLNRRKRRKISDKDVYKNQNPIMREKRKEFKISCFSGVNDNVLMWSHYGDKHNGICCGFNFPIKYENKFTIVRVKYLEKVEKLAGDIDLYKVILFWLSTKSLVWKYEEEYRAITLSKNTSENYENVEFDKEYLKEIIFGCNVKKNKILETLKKLRDSGVNIGNISIKRAFLDPENYNLKIVDFVNER